jgi:hypothetical protein
MQKLGIESEKMPSILYHYTDIQAVIGIIENRDIWMSHVLFMNDKEEVKDAEKIISSVIEELRETNKCDSAFISYINEIERSPYFTTDYPVAVISLSEKKDSLSQWRGYCPYGGGVSIGIAPAEIEVIKNDGGGYFLSSLYRCIYDDETKRRIINSIITEKYSSYISDNIDSDLAPDACAIVLSIAKSIFKNQSFAEEQEWRIVSLPLNRQDWDFRAGKNCLIPFIKQRLDQLNFIKEIWIGPSFRQDLSKKSLRMLLQKHEIQPELLCSNTPLTIP